MDANDFKRKFLPYHRKLYRAAFHLMGNTQDAEDMVQEAYLKLWKRRDELPTDIANLEAYCVTLVKHVCHDALRLAHLEEDGCPPEELPIAGSTNVAHEVELKDEARQVITLISQLPDQQRQIMQMRDVEDLPYEEIEKATGLTSVNIRVLLSRARKKIREQFLAIRNYERL
jgi:RNA polymerase sigma-70 factor (ECF subfamily)